MSSHYDRILAYLDHEMAVDERIQFENEIESNPELKADFEFYRTLILGIESEGQEELKEYIRSRVNEESTETKTNLWVYAAATVTILMVGYVAIYQYTKTGSLQPAKDFISLSKESGEKVKFWKKNRNPNSSNELAESDTILMYTLDSLGNPIDSESSTNSNSVAVLGEDISGMSDVASPTIEDRDGTEILENDNKISSGKKSSADAGYRGFDKIENSGVTTEDQTATKPAVSVSPNLKKSTDLSTNRYKTKEKVAPSSVKSKVAASVDINEQATAVATIPKMDPSSIHFVRKVSLVPVLLGSNTNVSENTLSSADKKLRFTVSFFEWDNGSKLRSSSFKIYKNKGSIYIDLYNLSGENPLIYHIDSDFFLELGPNLIYNIPSVIPSDISNPTPIKNKQIIKLIQDSDQ
jgi:hypothetical protein